MPGDVPQGNLVRIFGPGGFRAGQKPSPRSGPIENAAEAFLAVMRGEGYQLERINADGEIHRCPDADDKPNGDAGWYWLRLDAGKKGRAIACYGTWRLGGYTVWVHGATNGDARLTPAEQAAFDALLRELRERREAEAAESHERAAGHAAERLRECRPASAGHPYLVAKGVAGAHLAGLYQFDQTLIVPRVDLDGLLWSLQFITADGEKLNQKGARAGGTCFFIGNYTGAGPLALVEGLATGLTVHQASGWPVAVCFDADGVEKMARAARKHWPGARLVVCADDDHEKPPNRGLAAAATAQADAGAEVAVPPALLAGESDWNDLAARIGLEEVGALLEGAVRIEPLAVFNVANWTAIAPTPVSWLVEPWLVRGYVNALYADGGTGKTTLMQQFATCVATGEPWFGLHCAPGPVLMILCEDDAAAVHFRQDTINRWLGVTDPAQFVHPLDVVPRLADVSYLARRDARSGAWQLTQFFLQLEQHLQRAAAAGRGYVTLIMDSLADLYPGNEIDRAAVSEFAAGTLARLASEFQLALVYLGHTPKGQNNSYSGSTAWNAKVKSRMLLEGDADVPGRVVLSLEKSNFAPTGRTIELRRFAGVLMAPESIPSDLRDAAEEVEFRKTVVNAFMTMMREAEAAGQNISTQVNAPRNYAPRHFTGQQRRHGFKFTEAQYERAMHELLAQRVLVTVPSNRGRSERLEILPGGHPWQDEKDTDTDPKDPPADPPSDP